MLPSLHDKAVVVHTWVVTCPKKSHCLYRTAHTGGHSIYFLAAWAEGHGIYAMISLALLGLMWVGILLKEEEQ